MPHDLSWLTARPIAHRGLHDGNRQVCENSLGAFRAALEGGYAIECDVHLSGDGVPVVFHDGDLERLTGTSGSLDARTAAELGELRLGETADTIPTLQALLELVSGRVPIVVELKGRDAERDRGFAAALAPLLSAYRGPLALMSFDDWLVEAAASIGSHPVGLTAEGLREDALARHRAVFERHCGFVSYNVHHLDNRFCDWLRNEARSPLISWTVRLPDERRLSERFADQMTFEGFRP